MKQCIECGQWFDLVFFRRTRVAYASATCGTRPVCVGCEQTARDARKAESRWPAKIRDTVRRHADRLKISVQTLEEKFGWTFERMLHEAQHAYKNGCPYCGKSFEGMGHGLADITLDIVDRSQPPYYTTNARWVCNTCNREKARTPPALWGAKLAAWNQWLRRPRWNRPMQMKLFT